MNSRDTILDKLKIDSGVQYEMPEIKLETICYDSLVGQFTQVSKMVGGDAIERKDKEDLNILISSLYPGAKNIASNLPDIHIATVNPDIVEDPHLLDELDVAIIEGEIGVAENGCVWIPQQVRQKVIYFIAEYLVILLDKEKLVTTMHDAYEKIAQQDHGFGVFISGPSKTADIEQALVVGAHGARGVTVILK